MISDLTYKVIAFSDMSTANWDDCVDWAIEMLQLGHETPSLLILAGLTKPTDQNEARDYLRMALRELELSEKTGDEATLSYASYYITRIASGEEIKRNLSMVYDFCLARDYDKLIYDFYLLHWAWSDLDYGNEFQHYWPDATKQNIAEVVIETAKKWVGVNRKHYVQQN